MDGEHARAAVAAGVTVTIDSDCHKAALLDRQMRLGVGTARRGLGRAAARPEHPAARRGPGLHRRQARARDGRYTAGLAARPGARGPSRLDPQSRATPAHLDCQDGCPLAAAVLLASGPGGRGPEPAAGPDRCRRRRRGRRRPTSPPRCSASTTRSRTSPRPSRRPTRAACCGGKRRKAAPSTSRSRARCGGTTPSPEKKLFVSDGRTMFLYFPADKQVMKNPVPDQDEATSAVLFLMGKGDIVRDFNVRWAEGGRRHRLPAAPGSQDPAGGVRLARGRGRPPHAADRGPHRRRCPGWPVVVRLQQFQGKRRTGR